MKKIRNTMKTKIRYQYIIALLGMIFFMGSQTSYVQAENTKNVAQTKTLKVYLPLQYGLVYLDEEGNPKGYTYEYLMKIAQRKGWNYEFIPVEPTPQNFAKGVEALKNGEVDILTMMLNDGTYNDVFDYSLVPYRQQTISFMALKDNQKVNERTFLEMPDLVLALSENEPEDNAIVEEFCELNGFPLKIVYAPTREDCIALLESGKADAMIGRNTIMEAKLKEITPFKMQAFYFATSKENPELSQELNEIVTEIETSKDVYFQLELGKKHFPKNGSSYVDLIPEESEYIKTVQTLRVAVLDNKAPVSDFNEKTGEFEGIIIDIMKDIQLRSGLPFTFTSVQTYEEMKEIMLAGEVDLLAGFPNDYELAKEYNVLLTTPAFKSPVVRLTSKSKKIENTEILVSSSIKTFDRSKEYIYIEDMNSIFKKINKGEYGTAYVNGYMAQRLMNYKNYNNLTTTSIPSNNYDLCIGVSCTMDLRLMSVLEQSILQMPKEELEDIIYRNASIMPQVTIWEYLIKNLQAFVMPIIAIFLVVIVLLLMLIYKSRRLNRMIADERSRYKAKAAVDQMTGLYNNETFKSLVKNYVENSENNPKGTLIICDIDDFKQINDTYGHLFGDVMLSEIGNQLKNIFSENSIIGRIGGDEFAILMRECTDKDAITTMCKTLLEKCAAADANYEVTLSMGIAIFEKEIEFEKLFYRADGMLYEVKTAGKCNLKIVEL